MNMRKRQAPPSPTRLPGRTKKPEAPSLFRAGYLGSESRTTPGDGTAKYANKDTL